MTPKPNVTGVMVPLDRIIIGDVLRVPNRHQVNELAKRIRKTHMEHPITVIDAGCGNYTLIDGYARLQACQHLGLGRIECKVLDKRALHNFQQKAVDHIVKVAPITMPKSLGQCLKEAMELRDARKAAEEASRKVGEPDFIGVMFSATRLVMHDGEVAGGEVLVQDGTFEECARAISSLIDVVPEPGVEYQCLDGDGICVIEELT